MASHKCPAPRCDKQVPENRLACRTDWYRLPKPIRDRVWEAWFGGGAGSQEHMDAIAEAGRWYRDND